MRECYPEGRILSSLKERSADHRVYYLTLSRSIVLCLIETCTSQLYLVVRSPSERLFVTWLLLEPGHRSATYQPQSSEKTDDPTPRPTNKVREPGKVGWPATLSRVDERSWPMRDLRDTRAFLDRVSKESLAKEVELVKAKNQLQPPPLPDPPYGFQNNGTETPVHPAHLARLFLFQSGLLNPHVLNDTSVSLLEEKPALRRCLEELDSMPARPCLTVVVLFQRHRQDSFLTALKNERVLLDPPFKKFATTLGNQIVDVNSYGGWTGLKNTRDNLHFPHFCDPRVEISFILPNLLPSDTQAPFSQSDLFTDVTWSYPKSQRSCFLIWAEDPEALNMPKIFGEIQMIFGLNQSSTAVLVISKVSGSRFSFCISIHLGDRHQVTSMPGLQASELPDRIRNLCCEYSRVRLTAEKERQNYIKNTIVRKFSSLDKDAVFEKLFV